jgi:hypothetical protein
MALRPILAPIDNSLVSYTPGQPEFLQLVTDTLGNVGTPSDGFDSAINAIMALMPGTDAAMAALDAPLYDMGNAVAEFDALDTTAPFADWIGALPPLGALPSAPSPAGVGGVTLPALPPPPGTAPPAPPPQICVPAPPQVCVPAPSPPAPAPLPPPPVPTPTPKPGPCPQGWSFVAGKCQPPPAPSPEPAPAPPIILPPLPAGLPPCGPDSRFVPGIDCLQTTGTNTTGIKFVLALGQEVIQTITAAEMTAAATSWVTAFGLTTLTAVPVVGALIAVGALIWSFLGGGCGQTCVDAAKVEQVFEAAATNLLLIGRAGMMGQKEVIVGIHHFLNVGLVAETRLATTAAFNGANNLRTVLNNLLVSASALPLTGTKPLYLATARTLYVGGTGWYPDSIALASQMTDQFLIGAGAIKPPA